MAKPSAKARLQGIEHRPDFSRFTSGPRHRSAGKSDFLNMNSTHSLETTGTNYNLSRISCTGARNGTPSVMAARFSEECRVNDFDECFISNPLSCPPQQKDGLIRQAVFDGAREWLIGS